MTNLAYSSKDRVNGSFAWPNFLMLCFYVFCIGEGICSGNCDCVWRGRCDIWNNIASLAIVCVQSVTWPSPPEGNCLLLCLFLSSTGEVCLHFIDMKIGDKLQS